MKVAIDISPLKSGHSFRGSGFYVSNLKENLVKYHSDNEYIFFENYKEAPKKIDLVHFPYFDPFFLTLPLMKSTKTVVTVHDLIPIVFKDKFPVGLKGFLKWQIQKKSLQTSSAIITDSHSSKKDIAKFANIDGKKIHVVHLAASEHFKPLQKNIAQKNIDKFNLPKDFLLYVGDVTWNKNLPNLISAINKTNYTLVIAGKSFANNDYDKTNPWNKSLYEAKVLSQNNKNIISLGFVSDEELIALYNLATCLIMPSFYEGFGLPVLEAMQAGCPVITSKGGSLEEVADNATYFIEPEKIESILKGIEEVMENSQLQKSLREKGFRNAEKYSWKETANQAIKVYEEVLNN